IQFRHVHDHVAQSDQFVGRRGRSLPARLRSGAHTAGRSARPSGIFRFEVPRMELAGLIDALSDPRAYPDPVDSVEVRQTHISVAFLVGPWVYKIKKPVRLGFLDYSSLERRRHYCDEEVRINRRLAPEVYAGVVVVAASGEGVQVEGQGQVIEWAVKMVRLP